MRAVRIGRSPAAVALLTVVLAATYGVAVSRLPSSASTTAFWAGNFSAPWAVIPFAAGWAQRRLRTSVLVGTAAEVACVCGFYLSFLTLDTARLELARTTPWWQTLLVSLSRWAAFIAPWVVVAVLAGALYAAIGAWWRRTPTVYAAAALAVPFLVEPWIWPLYNRGYRGPATYWIAETLIGLALGALMVRTARAAT